jgi:hypothetical protein
MSSVLTFSRTQRLTGKMNSKSFLKSHKPFCLLLSRDRTQFMAFGNPPMDASAWGRYLRPHGEYNPNRPSDGLLRGELLIKVCKRRSICRYLLTLPRRLRMRSSSPLPHLRLCQPVLGHGGAGDINQSESPKVISSPKLHHHSSLTLRLS